MEKNLNSNDFTGYLKDKNIPTKESQTANKETPKKVGSISLRERALISFKNLYGRMRKAFLKSKGFGLFLFSVMLFVACPAYIQYMNGQLYNYFKANGGFRKEGGSMSPGMRPY